MATSRVGTTIGALLVTLAMGSPALAQGKSQQAKDKNGKGSGNSSSGGKGQSTPNQSSLPAAASLAGPTSSAAPFAWVDGASLMEPGQVWLGFSTVRWQGGGLSEVSVPIVDGAIGLTSRIQLSASVPRVSGSGVPDGPEGGIGTTFFSAKVGVLDDEARGFRIAVAPTLEVLSRAAVDASATGESRARFGLPVSVDLDRGGMRVYGSSGYFSPGVWYVGAGVSRQLTSRLGAALSLSRAWSSSGSADPAVPAPVRHDLSTGVSFDLTPHVGFFGSIGRTLGTSEENGAGTTLGFGVSLTAGPAAFTK